MADTTSLSELIADNSSVVSGLALIVWDGLISLSEEKRQIWDHKLTGSSLLYLVIRYGGLFEFALETVDVAPNVGTTGCGYEYYPRKCLAAIRLVAFPDLLRTVGLGLFSALRILAISDRNWTLFGIVLLLCVWPIVINTYQFVTAVLIIDNRYHTGCAGVPKSISALSSMVIQVLEDGTLIIAEGLVIIATVKKTFKYRKRQGTGPRFSRLLLRDGTILFLVLLLLAGLDMLLVLITYFGPATEFVQNLCLVQNLLVALRVVIVCRFILNLRAICYDDTYQSVTRSGGNGQHLTSRIIGTLGSSLRSQASEEDIGESEKEIFSADPFILGLMIDSDSEKNDNATLSSKFVQGQDPEKREGDQQFVGVPLRRGDDVVFTELRVMIDISHGVLE